MSPLTEDPPERRRRPRRPRSPVAQRSPSIIIIDGIDAVGRSRTRAFAVGGYDEREQTLNKIITEVDGFSGSEGVVVSRFASQRLRSPHRGIGRPATCVLVFCWRRQLLLEVLMSSNPVA